MYVCETPRMRWRRGSDPHPNPDPPYGTYPVNQRPVGVRMATPQPGHDVGDRAALQVCALVVMRVKVLSVVRQHMGPNKVDSLNPTKPPHITHQDGHVGERDGPLGGKAQHQDVERHENACWLMVVCGNTNGNDRA